MAIILFWLGLVLVTLGIGALASEIYNRRGCVTVRGRVIGYAQGPSQSGVSYRAIVEFTGVDGERRFIESPLGSSSPLGKIGDQKTVFVRPSQSEHASLKSPFMWIVSAILIALAIASFWLFQKTFEPNWFNACFALIITGALGRKVYKARRTTKISWADWRAKIQANRSRVYLANQFDEIKWLDPRLAGSSGARLVASTPVQTAPVEAVRRLSELSRPILFLLMCVSLSGSYYLYQKKAAFLKLAQSVQGQVVRFVEVRSPDSTTLAPIVRFQPQPSAAPIEFKHSFSSSPPRYRVGETVPVLFNPENPSQAQIDLGIWNQLYASLAGILGLVFAIALLSASTNEERREVRYRPPPD